MNSIIQCLSNTEPLTIYMLLYYEKDFKTGEKKRPFTTEYLNLLKRLWFEESKFFPPKDFKATLGKRNPVFDNHNQHDTQEAYLTIL